MTLPANTPNSDIAAAIIGKQLPAVQAIQAALTALQQAVTQGQQAIAGLPQDDISQAFTNMAGMAVSYGTTIQQILNRLQPPTASNASADVTLNTAATIDLSGDIQNASVVSIATPPSHGTAVANGLQVVYTPANGYTGADAFTYNASSPGSQTMATATVNLNVAAPQAAAGSSSGSSTSGTTVGAASSGS